MSKQFWIPVLIGIGVIGYMWMKRKNSGTPEDIASEAISVAKAEATSDFTPAFKAQYEVIMPPGQASNAVKQAAFKMQDDRKAKELLRIANKLPVYV